MLKKVKTILAAGLVLVASSAAQAADTVTLLFSAPHTVPAFIAMHLAKHKGYFAAEGLEVKFQTGKGGADTAKQVAVGNVEFGIGFADAVILVRGNGLPVRIVTQLGQGSIAQLIVRKDSKITSFADLKGKNIGVGSFTSTNYFALLGGLATAGVAKTDVNIQSVGVAGTFQLMANGNLPAIVEALEKYDELRAAGIEVENYPISDIFPALPQGIYASDEMIAKNPNLVARFVKAVNKAVNSIVENPEQAMKDYIAAMPQFAGKEDLYRGIIRRYVDLVFKPKGHNGSISQSNPERLATVQEFYLKNGIITQSVKVDDLYTNRFE
jgi:NitT/TauT family transport system substrate-binding protein